MDRKLSLDNWQTSTPLTSSYAGPPGSSREFDQSLENNWATGSLNLSRSTATSEPPPVKQESNDEVPGALVGVSPSMMQSVFDSNVGATNLDAFKRSPSIKFALLPDIVILSAEDDLDAMFFTHDMTCKDINEVQEHSSISLARKI